MLFGSSGAAGAHRGRGRAAARVPLAPTVANERALHAAQVRSLLRAVGAHLVSLRLTEEADGAEYASRLCRWVAYLP